MIIVYLIQCYVIEPELSWHDLTKASSRSYGSTQTN